MDGKIDIVESTQISQNDDDSFENTSRYKDQQESYA